MGAVYAIFAGFYYWIGKITGYQYNETLGRVHFILFTIAINLVFFPMHMLGLAGMPRRIPDYADGYVNWNQFITLGSFLTLFSVLIFLYIILETFSTTNTKSTIVLRNRWELKG